MAGAGVLILVWLAMAAPWQRGAQVQPGLQQPVPIAVLGDSDSHSYHDAINITGPAKRGGRLRASTWQWTEILARLRGRQLDQGEWGTWGMPDRAARLLELFGLPARAPRKQDFRFNFAYSGAECADLMSGQFREAPRLLGLMDQDPEFWRHGIVVIRIGINSIGQEPHLERYAREGATESSEAAVFECTRAIRTAVALIKGRHPGVRFLLDGIFDNANWAPLAHRWPAAAEQSNIAAVLDIFDGELRKMAAADQNLAFLDDRKWFRTAWGGRGQNGEPQYRLVRIGALQVANTQGDEPNHSTLADGHGGTVFNALLAREHVDALNSAFAVGIPPISLEEIAEIATTEVTVANRAPGDR